MSNKGIAIYARRSVEDKDNKSLSIASQIADCVKYIKQEYGEDVKYQIYEEEGHSGKDIQHRPAFRQLLDDVENGLIDIIIVKKYDRFSRNLCDALNVFKMFEVKKASVKSLTEPFDMTKADGAMMVHNILTFAEYEQKTISARVADAYDTRAHETGFYQGGKVYFGYQSSRQTVNGKVGSVLVPSSQALALQKMYEIYAKPETSLEDIVKYIVENDISVAYDTGRFKSDNLDCSHISRLLESPLYVRADKEVYRYLSALNYELLDDISAYDGIHGLFLHGKFNNKSGEKPFVKVGYHEGLVDAQTWLTVQDKKAHKTKYKGKQKALNSWLVGLVKCAHCGRAFTIITQTNKSGSKTWRYYRDGGYVTTQGCLRRTPNIRPDEVENAVFEAIRERLNALEIAKHENEKPNPEIETLQTEIISAEDEINKLVDKLADANKALTKRINERVSKLDEYIQELEQKLQSQMRKRKAVDTTPLDEPLSRWNELTTQEKRNVAGKIIEVIRVSDETGIDITFSI